jgi:acetylornithine aminotransferase
VTDVRGLGLLQGVATDGPVAPVVARARALGLLVVSAGSDVVRLVPPLNTEPELLDHGVGLLEEAMA